MPCRDYYDDEIAAQTAAEQLKRIALLEAMLCGTLKYALLTLGTTEAVLDHVTQHLGTIEAVLDRMEHHDLFTEMGVSREEFLREWVEHNRRDEERARREYAEEQQHQALEEARRRVNAALTPAQKKLLGIKF